jgi:hypothetical protein
MAVRNLREGVALNLTDDLVSATPAVDTELIAPTPPPPTEESPPPAVPADPAAGTAAAPQPTAAVPQPTPAPVAPEPQQTAPLGG